MKTPDRDNRSALFSLVRDVSRRVRTARRRGTFLVLVVGTLAMLSIIMIVYVAVGNADQRTSSSVARRDRSNEVVDQFADYVSQIIADDATMVVPDPSNPDPTDPRKPSTMPGGLLYSRETWDAPRTDWFVDSSVNDRTNAKFFYPAGRGDDPWLASTTPTWINYRPQQTSPEPTDKTFTKRVDWLHITNIAPDGRFVNLANLRGSFNAEPGFNAGSGQVGGTRMSTGLALWDATTGGDSMRTIWGDNVRDSSVSAFFDSWQVGAFRPASAPFKVGGAEVLPRETFYPPNQWADADGDGFLDSRWFEMVDARGPNFAQPQSWTTLIPVDPNYRWFFAARIIDLSSLVNVNVATDLNANPNDISTLADASGNALGSAAWKAGSHVLGRTPADVDLRRLLTMRDFREVVLGKPANAGVPQTINPTDVLQIADFNPSNPLTAITRNYSGGYAGIRQGNAGTVQDYSRYSALTTDIAGTPGITASTLENDLNLGLGAYTSLRAAVLLGRSPGRFSNFSVNGPLKVAARPLGNPQLRAEQMLFNAAAFDRPVYRANSIDAYRNEAGFDFGLGFASDAQVELLTYRGINDSSVTSTLEGAMGGRAVSEFAIEPSINTVPLRLSPMRENRSIELERGSLVDTNGRPSEAVLLKAYTDVRQYLTTMSGARPLMSVIQPANPVIGVPSAESPGSLGTNEVSIALTGNTTVGEIFRGTAEALMPGLSSSAAATTLLDSAWNAPSDNDAKALRGMFYGHQGPMTALLTAAHVAANFDSGSKLKTASGAGLPYTLVLSEADQVENTNNKLPTNLTVANTDGWRQHFPGWWAGNQLNLARPAASRANPATNPVRRIPAKTGPSEPDAPVPAVNVFGTGNVHPFLAGVATYTVYRDVSPRAFDSDKFRSQPDFEGLNTTRPGEQQFITINGSLEDLNQDFLFRLFAVQIQNPHPVPIELSTDFAASSTAQTKAAGASQVPANTGQSFFYVRAGGGSDAKYFVLADVDEKKTGDEYSGEYSVQNVVIQPGETIVFYALSTDRKSIVEERLNASSVLPAGVSDVSSELLETWIEKQIGPKTATNFRRIQMLRVDDAVFATGVNQIARATFAPGGDSTGVLVPDSSKSQSDDSVFLYRSLRAEMGSSTTDVGTGVPNIAANDALCDRLRIGQSAALDRRLNPGVIGATNQPVTSRVLTAETGNADRDQQIAGPGPRRFGNPPRLDYNSRLTVNVSVLVRRKFGEKTAIGQIPLWAVDPKDATDWYESRETPNASFVRTPFQLSLAVLDANEGTNWVGPNASFRSSLWHLQNPIFEEMTKPVGEVGMSTKDNLAGEKFVDLRRELATNGRGYRADSLTSSTAQVYQARPVDLLGVLAVGAYEAPLDATGNPITDLNKRWTTTAEALAIAFGYSKRPTDSQTWTQAGNTYGPLDYYYYDRYSTAANPAPLFDGGYLKLSDYVCSRIDMTNPAQPKYYPAGNGAPIAGNLLTVFRTIPDRFASLTSSVPGLININTAPIAVLRVLPLAAPAQDVASVVHAPNANTPNTTKPTFWPALNGQNADVVAQRTDIAAMIESYRDKIAVELRPGAKNPASSPQTATPHYSWFAPFVDRNAPSVLNLASSGRIKPNDLQIGRTDNLPATYSGGRYWTTGLTGIREEAGFRSLAELLALRSVKVDTTTTGGQKDGSDQPTNIDFLGYVGSAAAPEGTKLLGVDNVLELTADANGVVGDAKPLQFANTNQDRLKVLAALGGSVTVRSDVYAAWFVMRGYQRSDVEGLSDDQPMTPSIERRFLMLIDRSNVTKPGQKPRIIAMVELPL